MIMTSQTMSNAETGKYVAVNPSPDGVLANLFLMGGADPAPPLRNHTCSAYFCEIFSPINSPDNFLQLL